MENNTDRAAAMALLDRGVGFSIPAPFFYRIFGRKKMKISVKRLRLGTLVHLSTISEFELIDTIHASSPEYKGVIKEMGADPKSLPIQTIIDNIKPVTLAVASCLLNSPIKIKLFSQLLAWHLRRSRVTADQLQELLMWIFIYGRAESFTNTTKLLSRMTMMKPRNLGQE
jgi:hypothetical protein